MCSCGKERARGDTEASVGTVGAFVGGGATFADYTSASCSEGTFRSGSVEGKATFPVLGDLGRVLLEPIAHRQQAQPLTGPTSSPPRPSGCLLYQLPRAHGGGAVAS